MLGSAVLTRAVKVTGCPKTALGGSTGATDNVAVVLALLTVCEIDVEPPTNTASVVV